MSTSPFNSALESAWRRFAEYDYNAVINQNRYIRLRKWSLALSVVVTILAVVLWVLKPMQLSGFIKYETYLRYVMIGAPIIVGFLMALVVKSASGARWIRLRSSAESIKKEMYRYRAQVEIYSPRQTRSRSRDEKLTRKAEAVGRRLEGLRALRAYEGQVPPQYGAAAGDDGFADLDPESYIRWRLEDQRSYYLKKARQLSRQLRWLLWLVYVLGGVGALLAAIGLEIWIAVSSALAGALIGYLEFKRLSNVLAAYNQAATDLDGIRIWWRALSDAARRKHSYFERLVRYTEAVIQAEHAGWVDEMRDALADISGQPQPEQDEAPPVGSTDGDEMPEMGKAVEAKSALGRLEPFSMIFPNRAHATAVRTEPDADPVAVAAALDLPDPDKVFVLTGGADQMTEAQRSRLEEMFNALGEMLVSERATVVDGGTKSGVMALLGQALAQSGRTTPYVGVLPADARDEAGNRGEEIVETHHSHFVLVESDEWGSESRLLSDLAAEIAGSAPAVTLLVNGGGIALQDVEWSVKQGREIVVVAGSGRLADEIVEALQNPEQPARDRIAAIVREGRLTVFDLSAPLEELTDLVRWRLRERGETTMTLETESVAAENDISPPLEMGDALSTPTLEDAWQRFVLYDHNAILTQRRFSRLRWWILTLGVTATTLAVLQTFLEPFALPPLVGQVLRYLIIVAPILVTVLLAGAEKLDRGMSWVLLRASAENIKKEIFRYRARVDIYSPAKTKNESAEIKLARKIKNVGGQLMRTEVNQGSLAKYEGEVPPRYGAADADDGYSALTPDTYLKWRLEDQYNFYSRRARQYDNKIRWLRWTIVGLGGLGTLLAAVGQEIWVAVTVGAGGAMTAWLELRKYEDTLTTYNQASTDLEGIRIWWRSLSPEAQRDPVNFGKLVKNTEDVLSAEHAGWVQEMRDALEELYAESEEST